MSRWTHLPSSIATMLAHAFSTPTKVTESGCTPSCCICWNSPSAFWPHFRCANIMVLQWPHFEMASCWTISKHPQCSHILHTCPLSYSPQRHQTHNEFEQAVYEQACHLQMFVKQHNALNQLNKSEFVRTHSLLSHLLEKLHHHLQSPILHMFCKLPIACKYVELHYTWCLRSYLCCHPWWVSSVLYTKCFPCVLVLKSGYPSFVNNQKSRSSWSAMYSPHPGNKYHKNRERCSDLLHQHLALTYFLQPTTTTPPVQRTWKEILPSLDQGRITTTNKEKEDWHQQEVWLHWHVNSDRFDVQLPSLTHDPNIAKDP